MTQREAISKKLRFEIFKRDKFTCQYCGGKAPDVVLNVDHIEPVAHGGSNEVLNLITSCFSCNSGKSDRKLSDSSVVEKQRKQLELLAERREQIELMLEWKKSLSNFENDIVNMISDYINSKIAPRSLNVNGKISVSNWLKKYETEKILDAIDISAKQYLKYENGEIDIESIEMFFNKIGGIIVVKSLPPIKQKLAFIKGIARNKFSYWDDKKGSIILSNYIKQLENHYDEENLLEDLENEVLKMTKDAKNWSEWRNTLENWTSQISAWQTKPETVDGSTNLKDYSLEQLESFVSYNSFEQEYKIKALEHIGTIFPKFELDTFRVTLKKDLILFLKLHNDTENGETEYDEAMEYIGSHLQFAEVKKYFDFDEEDVNLFGTLLVLEPITNQLLKEIFFCCYYPSNNAKKEYKDIMIELNIKYLEKNVSR